VIIQITFNKVFTGEGAIGRLKASYLSEIRTGITTRLVPKDYNLLKFQKKITRICPLTYERT